MMYQNICGKRIKEHFNGVGTVEMDVDEVRDLPKIVAEHWTNPRRQAVLIAEVGQVPPKVEVPVIPDVKDCPVEEALQKETLSLEDLTIREIREMLDSRGIKYSARDNKTVLLAKLRGE